MRFALGLSEDIVVVQVLTGDRDVDDLTARWEEVAVRPVVAEGRRPPRLVVLRSEYRQLYAPLLDLVGRLEKDCGDRPIAVVVPELVEARWYHHFLHNHTASMMKALLLYRGGPQTVIVNVPFYLRLWGRERRRAHRASVNVPKSAELGLPV
jgi:hypothetical protein